MTELLTAAQMRAAETSAIESGDVTGLALMERAGRGVVEAIFETWPELAEGAFRAVVLCGPGNNGGDGFVIARRLLDKGWEVELLFWGARDKLSEDARRNYDIWSEMGEIHALSAERAGQGLRPHVVIDAMFGTGLSRAIPLELALTHHAVRARAPEKGAGYHRVAVDCPSGLDCDSGYVLLPERPKETGDEAADLDAQLTWWSEDASQRFLHTDLTVSFHRKKLGHVLSEGCGDVKVVDIGLGAEDRHPAHLKAARGADLVTGLEFDRPEGRSRRIWPGVDLDKRFAREGHKYGHGHALVLSGGAGRTGAARLAARAALRIGAGLVTLGVPPSAQMEVASQITALMLTRVEDARGLTEVLEDARITAVCLGPGLGLERARALVPVVCGGVEPRPTVLDADALTGFAEAPQALFEMLHDGCVLTPHGGEFKRLFPDIADQLNAAPTKGPAFSKVDATRAAAARAGCVVVFKGECTVIAAPDGRCSVHAARNDRAAPWLASAGTGDVLAGFITGLVARGLAPMAACEIAVWLHVEAARCFGPGLIAEDLPEILPKVLRELGV